MTGRHCWPGPIGALLLLTACGGRERADLATDATVDSTVAQIVGTVDARFGAGLNRVDWGNISGIAVSDSGSIAVADAGSNRVAMLSPSGDVQFLLGGEGAQPGQLALPCCVAFGPHGELWVREGSNARYSVFRLARDRAVLLRLLPIEHRGPGVWARTTFDSSGRLIDVGAASDDRTGDPIVVRFHRDSAGTSHERDTLPTPTDRLGVVTVTRRTPDGVTRRYFNAPFGPAFLVAHAPGGEWADAVSSTYVVTWRDPSGAVLHTLRRGVEGPALSRADKADATRSLKEQALVAGHRLPFGVPDRKPALAALFFDAQRRLWVERNVAPGSDRIADVYSHGRLVAVARWPHDISLDVGAVEPGYALGVRHDDMDIERVVRLVLTTTEPPGTRTLSARRLVDR